MNTFTISFEQLLNYFIFLNTFSAKSNDYRTTNSIMLLSIVFALFVIIFLMIFVIETLFSFEIHNNSIKTVDNFNLSTAIELPLNNHDIVLYENKKI